jgi:hypothetical protein
MLHLFCVWPKMFPTFKGISSIPGGQNTYVNLPWMVINLLYVTVFLMLNRLERHQLY